MFFSSISAAIVTAVLSFTAPLHGVPTTGDAPSTHTLLLRTTQAGSILIDGVPSQDTIFQLSSAHIATIAREGGTLSTVTMPDGRTYFKGSFSLAVQSHKTGTVRIELVDGEAILATVPSN